MTSSTPLSGLSHLDLSVSDHHASAQWYADILGFEIRGDRFNEAARLPWVHLMHSCGLSMGLVEHPDNPGEPFDERRSGLDHVSFGVATRGGHPRAGPARICTWMRRPRHHRDR